MSLNETSVIIVTYNHSDFIRDCLKSILYNPEIIVVDNNSSDDTIKIIEKEFPQVKLIKNSKNIGFGAGVNVGVKSASGKYLIILNPDTKVKENSLKKLIEPLKKDDKLITTPKVLFYDKSKINTCGNIAHFTGLAFTRNLGQDPKKCNKTKYVKGLSGVCFAITKETYLKIGGFNDKLFLYMEDTELTWKAEANGLKILFVHDSIICHDYKLKVTPEKIYHLERGRYIIIRKYFTWKEYIKLSPSFSMTEILTLGYCILKGPSGIKYKLKAIKDGLSIKVNKYDSNRNKLIKSLDWQIPKEQLSYGHTDKIIKKIANTIYSLNLKLIK